MKTTARAIVSTEKYLGAGTRIDGVDDRDRRELLPQRCGRTFPVANLYRRMIDCGVGRLGANFDRESSGPRIPIRIKRDRQEIRQWRLEPTALTEGLLSSKRQQPAAT